MGNLHYMILFGIKNDNNIQSILSNMIKIFYYDFLISNLALVLPFVFFDIFYITKRLKLHKLQNGKNRIKVISRKLLTFFNDLLLPIIEIFTLLEKYLYQVHMLETCQFYKQY